MIELFLTRHGRTDYNTKGLTSGWDDAVLTDEGKKQAVGVGKALVSIPPEIIYCSTLHRAIVTAEIIQKECGGTIYHRENLRERNLGVMQGVPEAEYQAFLKSIQGDINQYRFDGGGESRDDVKLRTRRVLEEILNHHEGKRILIVGHHSTNRAILSNCLGGEPASYTQRNCTLSLMIKSPDSGWSASYLDKDVIK